MIILLTILAVLLIIFLIVDKLLKRVPEGWEDEYGFHRGRKQ